MNFVLTPTWRGDNRLNTRKICVIMEKETKEEARYAAALLFIFVFLFCVHELDFSQLKSTV